MSSLVATSLPHSYRLVRCGETVGVTTAKRWSWSESVPAVFCHPPQNKSQTWPICQRCCFGKTIHLPDKFLRMVTQRLFYTAYCRYMSWQRKLPWHYWYWDKPWVRQLAGWSCSCLSQWSWRLWVWLSGPSLTVSHNLVSKSHRLSHTPSLWELWKKDIIKCCVNLV